MAGQAQWLCSNTSYTLLNPLYPLVKGWRHPQPIVAASSPCAAKPGGRVSDAVLADFDPHQNGWHRVFWKQVRRAASDETIRLTPSLRRGRPQLGPNCLIAPGRDCGLCTRTLTGSPRSASEAARPCRQRLKPSRVICSLVIQATCHEVG